jgi:hypothetical protein
MTALGSAAYLDLGCAYDRPGSYVTAVYSADLTGVGRQQLLAGSDNGQIMNFEYVKCAYEWTPKWSHLQPTGDKGVIVDMIASDVDNDGSVELVTAADTSYDYLMVLSNTGGFFKWSVDKAEGKAMALDVADVDADGTNDVVYGNEAGSVIMLSGGKNVSWTSAPLGAPIYAVAAVDLNDDGSIEIVALANKYLDAAKVSAIDSTGKTLWSYQIDVGIYQATKNSMSVGDLNDDGKPEIAVATHKKGVVVLDSAGALLWNYQLDNTVTAVHIPQGWGMVFAASNPNLYMLDADGGLSK